MGQRDNYPYGGEAHTAEYFAQYESTISNGEARIPICFCVDTSSSMNIVINDKSELREVRGTSRSRDGNSVITVEPRYSWVTLVTRLEELQTVFSKMIAKMQSNDILSKSAVICIVTFDLFADCYAEFTDLGRVSPDTPKSIRIGQDRTNASKGLRMALERLDQQQLMNSNAGNESYKPVLVFMSDGQATDGKEAELARQEVRQRSEDGKLNVIPIGIGKGIDERWLRGLSRESKVYHMDTDRDFEEVFEEITKRIQWTTTVISVDEDENNMANEVQDNVASTQYGQDYESFLEAFMNS